MKSANSKPSLNEIDYTTALARLLSDQNLRAEFKANPDAVTHKLAVRAEDFAAVAALAPDELEIQARVLLRKRLDAIRPIIPQTCARLGEALWPRFESYACRLPLVSSRGELQDALGFCLHMAEIDNGAVVQSELHRLRFVQGRRWLAVHFFQDLCMPSGPRPGMQLLIRFGRQCWREYSVFLAWGKPTLPLTSSLPSAAA